MRKLTQTLLTTMSSRLGLVFILLILYWLKSIAAYFLNFNLDIQLGNMQGFYQLALAILNPLPLGLLLLGLPFYAKPTKVYYPLLAIMYLVLFSWLFSNVIYYREFSDFITLNTMLASSSVSAGLGDAAAKLFRPFDLLYLLDLPLIVYLFWKKKVTFDDRPLSFNASFAITSLSTMLFSANLFFAEVDRPELLSRGFSNYYVVRALGLPAFFGYSANQTYQADKERAKASETDLEPVLEYIKEHNAEPNPATFGIAKGRNVIYLHLESFQQFLIDYKLKSNNQEYEVTPFINSLYHSSESFAFSNIFNQVKAGKTSDAETMIESGLFGLNQGSFMVNYGGTNTQQAAPHILAQTGDYTSAVFHGNIGSFWNRNTTYKQWGYNFFFDQSYMSKATSENSFQYGLNDKIMFKDSIKYLEHMQQPFYVKYLTVSNHYPYTTSLIGDEQGFPLAETKDETINGYFATANYLDSAIKSFFDYLKETGLYENSVIVLYGDHYGISNSRNPSLAPLLDKNPETWSSYDNAMLQRIPYIVVVPSMQDGAVIDTYGGQIDMLPTLEHLLGINSSNFLQVGQDLLSPDHEQIVAFRSSNYFVTPEYTSYSGRTYYTATGEEITTPDESTQKAIDEARDKANKQLSISDMIQTGDLLRFYSENRLGKPDVSKINYNKAMDQLLKIEKEKGQTSSSLFSQRQSSTLDLFDSPTYKALHPEQFLEDSDSSSSSSSSQEEAEE